MSKEAMKLALEALEHCKDAIVERGLNGSPEFAKKWGLTLPIERSEEAITALRQSIADEALDKKAENARALGLDYEPAQQEPLQNNPFDCGVYLGSGKDYAIKHHVSYGPAQQEPLTDEFLRKLHNIDQFGLFCDYDEFEQIARAIEAAHGIKGDA